MTHTSPNLYSLFGRWLGNSASLDNEGSISRTKTSANNIPGNQTSVATLRAHSEEKEGNPSI